MNHRLINYWQRWKLDFHASTKNITTKFLGLQLLAAQYSLLSETLILSQKKHWRGIAKAGWHNDSCATGLGLKITRRYRIYLWVLFLTNCCIMACLWARSFRTAVKTSHRPSLLICWTKIDSPTYKLLRSDPYLQNNEKMFTYSWEWTMI